VSDPIARPRPRDPEPRSRLGPPSSAALAAVALLLAAGVAGCGLISGKQRNEAIALYESGKLTEAIPKLKSALRSRPGDSETRRFLALALTKNGDGNEAIDEWLRVLKADPSSADGHYWLGIAYLSTNRRERAMQEWVKTIGLDSTHVSAHYNLGFAYAQMGIVPLAVEQWSQLLQVDPTHYDGRVNRGRLRVLQGDFLGGLEDFLIALAVKPDEELNWLCVGESYFLLDDSARAVSHIDSFLVYRVEEDEMAFRARELRRRIVAGEKAPTSKTSSLGIVPRDLSGLVGPDSGAAAPAPSDSTLE